MADEDPWIGRSVTAGKEEIPTTLASQSAVGVADDPWASRSVTAAPGEAPPTQAETDKKQYELQASWWQDAQAVADDLRFHYTKGERDVYNGTVGAQVIKGEKTYEEALKDTSTDTEDPIKDKTEMGKWVGMGAEMLPTIKYILEGGAQGAAGGAAVMGTVGAAVGVAGGPAAPVTVPGAAAGAAMWGAAVGGNAGMFTAAANVAAGHSYMTLRQEGLSDTAARAGAIGVGAVAGYLQGLKVDKLLGSGQDALVKEMATKEGKFLLGTAVKGWLENMGVQATINGVQKFTEQIIHTTTKVVERGNIKVSLDEILKGVGEVFGAAATGAAFGGVTHPVASVTGAALGKVMKTLFPKDLVDIHDGAAAAHAALLGEKPDYAEALAATRARAKRSIQELEHDVSELENELSQAELAGEEAAHTEIELEATTNALAQARKREFAADTKDLRDDIADAEKRLRGIPTEIVGIERRMAKMQTEGEEVSESLKTKRNLLKEEEKATKEAITKWQKQYDKRVAKELEKANARLDTALDKAKGAKGKRGKPTSKYDIDTQKTMDLYVDLTSDRTAEKSVKHLLGSTEEKQALQAEKDQAAIDNKMAKTDEAVDVAAKASADLVASDTMINYQDPLAVYKLADKINLVAAIGRDRKAVAKYEWARQKDHARDVVLSALNPEGKHHIDITAPFPKELTKMQEAFRMGLQEGMPWNALMGHIFQLAEDPTEALAATDLFEAVSHNDAQIQEQHRIAQDIVTGGKGPVHDFALKISNDNREKLWGEFVDQNGNRQPYNRTPWGVIQDIIDMRNAREGEGAKMYAGMRNGSKLTFENSAHNEPSANALLENERTFEGLLNDIQRKEPNFTKMGDGLLEFWNSDERYNRVNGPHLDEFAFDMPRENNYTGMRRRDGVNTGAKGSYFDTMVNGILPSRKSSLVPGSTIEAVHSDKPYVRADAWMVLQEGITAVESWRNLRKTEEMIRHIFSDKDVVKAIKMQFGSKAMEVINNSYSSILGTNGIQHAQRIEMMDAVRVKQGSAFVFLKPGALGQQMTSTINAVSTIGWEAWMNGMGDATLHPFKALNEFRKTDWWKTRWNNYTTEIAENRAQQGIWGREPNSKYIETTGLFMTTSDRTASLSMGWAVREAKIAEALAAGKTPAEAEAFGNMWAGKVVTEMGSSGTATQITYFERGGSFQKWAAQFAKQPIQIGQQYVLSIRRLINNPTKANMEVAARTIAAAHIAQGAFSAATSVFALGTRAAVGAAGSAIGVEVTPITNEDVQIEINRFYRNLLIPGTGLPVIGPVLDSIGIQVTNPLTGVHEFPVSSAHPLYELANNGGQLVVGLGKMAISAVNNEQIKPAAIFAALDNYARVAGVLPTTPISGGAPIKPVIKVAKPVFVRPEEKKKKGPKLPTSVY